MKLADPLANILEKGRRKRLTVPGTTAVVVSSSSTGLPYNYLAYGVIASHTPDEGGHAFPLTATEAREKAIKSVGREISRLRRLKKHLESVESSRLDYTAQSLLVPEIGGKLLTGCDFRALP